MNKLAILQSKTNILEMHQRCWEVFRPFAYNHSLPVNPQSRTSRTCHDKREMIRGEKPDRTIW
jgi:hypothetical protein